MGPHASAAVEDPVPLLNAPVIPSEARDPQVQPGFFYKKRASRVATRDDWRISEQVSDRLLSTPKVQSGRSAHGY